MTDRQPDEEVEPSAPGGPDVTDDDRAVPWRGAGGPPGDGVLSPAWKGDRCSACSTAILWRNHTGTGRAAPINARPDPGGNIVLVHPNRYAIIPPGTDPVDEPRHTNHFATCPDRHAFKGGR